MKKRRRRIEHNILEKKTEQKGENNCFVGESNTNIIISK